MVADTLQTLAQMLADHLRLSLGTDGDIVCLDSVGSKTDGLSGGAPSNRVHIALVNVERETGAGFRYGSQAISGERHKMTGPDWQVNLYVLIAAVFAGKQYADGLQMLSEVLLFLRNNATFQVQDGANTRLAMEPVNLSFSEQAHVWGMCGNTYYPSVLCKVRVLNLSSDRIRSMTKAVTREEIDL